jgi:hypothetical protein
MKNLLISFLFVVLTLNNSFGQVDPVTGQYSDNGNLLTNPGLESGLKSWTNSAGVFSLESSVVFKGKRAGKVVLSSQALNLHQDSTQYAAQLADGVQGLVYVRVKTSLSGVRVCSKQAGVASTSNCVSVLSNNKWGLYKVPSILGGTSNGISINSNGTSVTGTVYVDDAFVGAVDLQADVDASKLAGESYFAFGGSYTTTSFASASGSRSPTIVLQNEGSWQTASLAGYQQTVNSLPPGCYSYTWTFGANGSNIGATQRFAAAVNGVTQTGTETYFTQGSSMGSGVSVKGSHCITTAQNITYELRGASTVGSVGINQGVINFNLLKFSSDSNYSSTNADTDWTPFTMSIQATTTAPTKGSGGYENARWRRKGSMMEIRYQYYSTVAGSAGSGTYLFTLPNIAQCGGQCEVDSTKLIPAKLFTGETPIGYGITSSASGSASARVTPVLVGAALSATWASKAFALTYARSGLEDQSPIGSSYYALSTAQMTYDIFVQVPIKNWTDSNLIIGQFSGLEKCTNTLECTDTFSAKVSAAGVVSEENVDWVSGNATIIGTSVYNITFKTGVFSVAPNCVATPSASTGHPIARVEGSASATGISIYTSSQAANFTTPFQLICQKQGVDYVGKSAKAVSSDQNISTPGTIKSTFCSAKISSTGVISDQKGGCFASCTNAVTPICTFTSNYWSSTPNCWHIPDGQWFNAAILTTSTTVQGALANSSGSSQAGPRLYFCHGERQ